MVVASHSMPLCRNQVQVQVQSGSDASTGRETWLLVKHYGFSQPLEDRNG